MKQRRAQSIGANRRGGEAMASAVDIKAMIRTIPDFPKAGVQFRDITTLLKAPNGLREVVDRLVAGYANERIDKVAAIESRGFILGGALAYRFGAGFVPIRKKGKLPAENFGEDYALEYGRDRLEMHRDALEVGERVLLVDDLIATGGTAEAATRLIRTAGASLVGCAFVVDLPDLGGLARLQALGYRVHTLCAFSGY
jgi:adenine phosphoribosyltransferase